jgi:hypothetical protein
MGLQLVGEWPGGCPGRLSMGKFVTGLLLGLLLGLMFADVVFPEGFPHAVERWSTGVQSRIPGR